MKRQDEKDLMLYVQESRNIYEYDIDYKRLCYILDKWELAGLWECGISSICGWLTEKGKQIDVKKWDEPVKYEKGVW